MTTRQIVPMSHERYSSIWVHRPTQKELFEYQAQTLVYKGLASMEMFDRVARYIPSSGPFILMPPQPGSVDSLDWSELITSVVWRNHAGHVSAGMYHRFKDETETPKTTSILTEVDDGRWCMNRRPIDLREDIPKQGRCLYNLWMGYIHAVLFPEVLQHHRLALAGSSVVESTEYNTPLLTIRLTGKPVLSIISERYSDINLVGAPSFSEAITG